MRDTHYYVLGRPIWPEDFLAHKPEGVFEGSLDDLLKDVAAGHATAAHYRAAQAYGLPRLSDLMDPPAMEEFEIALPVGVETTTEEERARLRLPAEKQGFILPRRNRRLRALRLLRLGGVAGRLARRLQHDPDALYRLVTLSGLRVTYESLVNRDVSFTRQLGDSGIPVRIAIVVSAFQLSLPEAAELWEEAEIFEREGFRLLWCACGSGHVYFGDYHAHQACCVHTKAARQKRWRLTKQIRQS